MSFFIKVIEMPIRLGIDWIFSAFELKWFKSSRSQVWSGSKKGGNSPPIHTKRSRELEIWNEHIKRAWKIRSRYSGLK